MPLWRFHTWIGSFVRLTRFSHLPYFSKGWSTYDAIITVTVLSYFSGLATLSLKSFQGDNVWKMSVEEADFGMANISLPTDVSEIQRPQQLCSNCRQQLHRQLEACGWGSTLRPRRGRQQVGVVAHTVVLINSGCVTKQFRYLVRRAHCYNIQKTCSELSPWIVVGWVFRFSVRRNPKLWSICHK